MNSPLLLLETSDLGCSVAIAIQRSEHWQVLAKAESAPEMDHTAALLPTIKAAFAKTHFALADTAYIAVSAGPGSYTALRAGLSSAKGICLASGAKLIMVSTLAALADAARKKNPSWKGAIIAAIEARRDEVYFATFGENQEVLDIPTAGKLDEKWLKDRLQHGPLLVVGSGARKVAATYPGQIQHEEIPLEAGNLLAISTNRISHNDFDDVYLATPTYIKPPHITKAKNKF